MARKRRPIPEHQPAISDGAYQDRDLSRYEFNRRVLHEACDPRMPLLERLRFLANFWSNLDELFMTRNQIAKRREQAGAGVSVRDLRERIDPTLRKQAETFATLVVELRLHGIFLLPREEPSKAQHSEAREYFQSNVLLIPTPLAYDPAHPYPFLSNLSTSLGVIFSDLETAQCCFTRIKVPNVPRSRRSGPAASPEGAALGDPPGQPRGPSPALGHAARWDQRSAPSTRRRDGPRARGDPRLPHVPYTGPIPGVAGMTHAEWGYGRRPSDDTLVLNDWA